MSDTNEAPTRVGGFDQSEVALALEEYLALVEAGRRPDRAEFLARHPAVAHELADALDGLNFVRSAAVGLPPPAAATEGLPSTLGDYRIVREVGRGGMGVVYEAEQISLRRRVALKVLPFAAVMDPRQLQRFRNEALAAASLDHPHVVKVHGVGCERGVHFIALQYVDGRPLSDLIRERRDGVPGTTLPTAVEVDATRTYAADQTDGPARRPISPSRTPTDAGYVRRVAEWGVEVADALEHAHALGVVHRDVKPGNILVDENGRAYVADFGLARLATDPGVTASGDLLGTLRYMSPEQAAAKHDLVDHRSDVYSLGVTLYELLTLRPAFAGSSRAEVLRAVADTDPSPPRSQDRAIPRDLETVVLKAMDKDPSRRYQSAGELAADLRRFLAHEPVVAARPSLLDRSAKWARRHRAAVVAGVVLLVVTAAGSATAALLIADRQAGKDRALGEKDQALREKDQALLDRGAALDQATAEKRRAEETLTDAVALLRVVPTDYPTMARTDGSYDKVFELQRRSVVVLERQAAERPDDQELLHDLVNKYGELHFVAAEARRLHECVGTARRAADVWEERGINRVKDAVIGRRTYLAMALNTLGEAQLAAGDADRAAATFTAALDNWTAAFAEIPAFKTGIGQDVVRTRLGRATAMAAQGKYEDAVGEYRAALAAIDEIPASERMGFLRMDAARIQQRLGDVLWASGQKKEAGVAYAAAKAGLDKFGADKGKPHTAELAWLLAVCPDPAVRDPKTALEYAKEVKPGTQGGTLATLVVAVVEWRTGNAAAQVRVNLKDPAPADEAAAFGSRAVALHRQGKGDDARKQLDRATQAAKRCGENPEVRRLLAEAAAALSEPAPPQPGK